MDISIKGLNYFGIEEEEEKKEDLLFGIRRLRCAHDLGCHPCEMPKLCVRGAARSYSTRDIEGQRLVFAATGDAAVNQQVFDDCQAQAIPVNVVDQTALCSFIMPSIVDRSPVMVAVSTGGNAPALARLLRARLETVLPSGLGALAALAGRYRERVKAALTTVTERRRFWETAFEGEPAELVLAGRVEITQGSRPVDPSTAKGPIRVRRVR